MAALSASLHDAQGRILVPGFGDDAASITNSGRTATATLPMGEATFLAGIAGVRYGDPAYTVRELATLCPTIEVNGMWGAYRGAGTKTMLSAEAHATIAHAVE